MSDEEADRRKMSAAAARRLYRYVREREVPAQISLDIGIILGRLSYLEGPGWQTDDWHIEPHG
jgi:hypothetical protein